MEIRLIKEHSIRTRKFGLLTFSLLTSNEFLNIKKVLSSKITDKEFFINFLHHLLIKPKLSQNNLMSLSDNILIRIGKEIIKANHLNNDFVKNQEGDKSSFFTKYKKYIEKAINIQEKRIQKHLLPLNGISEKLKRFINSPALKMALEFQKRQDAISRSMYADSQLRESAMAMTNMHRDIIERASGFANMNRDLIERASAFANMNRDIIGKASVFSDMHKDMIEKTMIAAKIHQKTIENSIAASRMYDTPIKESINSILNQDALMKEAMLAATGMGSINHAYEEIQNLHKNLSIPDKNYYQSLAMSDVFNQSYSTSWEAMNKFMQNAEITEYYSEDEIAEVKTILEIIKDFVNERNLLSEEKISLLGFFVTSFLIGIKTVIEGINTGKLNETWGSIAIVNLYFFFLYSIFKILKKE